MRVALCVVQQEFIAEWLDSHAFLSCDSDLSSGAESAKRLPLSGKLTAGDIVAWQHNGQ